MISDEESSSSNCFLNVFSFSLLLSTLRCVCVVFGFFLIIIFSLLIYKFGFHQI